MSAAYKVVRSDSGCSACARGATYDVVGPDGAALSQSWVDYDEECLGQEEALKTADWLNGAFELGRQSQPASHQDPWRSLETDPPMVDCHILVWDEELKIVSTYWWSPTHSPERIVKELRYTHWQPELSAPKTPFIPEPTMPDASQPKVDSALVVLHVQCTKQTTCIFPDGHDGHCDDDLPF